jgi:DnaJ-domain-containing protein 1
MEDLYGILGLTNRATPNEIKSAYRRLARRFHPDVSQSPDAQARFVKINEAYQILSDPQRRRMYDQGMYADSGRTFYASRQAEVVAKQRHFDRIIDEWMARDRQEADQRAHAVLIVVPLFLSTFYVMAAKTTIIAKVNFVGRVTIIALAIYGLIYLVKNISIMLARYTYHIPPHMTSVFGEEAHPDKPISRTAALCFLVCGYVVSLGLGYVVSKLLPGYAARFPASTLIGAFIYPPIAVLLVGGIRRIANIIDRL